MTLSGVDYYPDDFYCYEFEVMMHLTTYKSLVRILEDIPSQDNHQAVVVKLAVGCTAKLAVESMMNY